MNRSQVPVAVIGAGPYGLSVSAHLTARGVEHRVFGRPMSLWTEHMPRGMYLKSEGHASSLGDPAGRRTYRAYADEHGIPYADIGLPLSLDDFVGYGLAFQKDLVPHVEDRQIVSLARSGARFDLELSDGSSLTADRVVLAVGVSAFAHLPSALAALPPGLVSHTQDTQDLERFSGRDVVVLGAGQSALETAALLHEAGARVRVLVRRGDVAWNPVPQRDRPLRLRVRYPSSGLGFGPRLYLYAEYPSAFRYLPGRTRLEAVRTTLGPAGGWWLRERVHGVIPVSVRARVRAARPAGGGVELDVEGPEGTTALAADHVIAGTGYRVHLQRLPFLARDVREATATLGGYPVLTGSFESTLPGLYFVGLTAAGSFGPVQRFVYGTHFTARRVAAALSNGAAP